MSLLYGIAMNVNKGNYEIGRGPRQQKSPNEYAAPTVAMPDSPGRPEDETGSSRGDAGDRARVDRMRPAVLRQMEQRVAADQGQVAPVGAVNVARLAGRHQRLRRDMVGRLAGAS